MEGGILNNMSCMKRYIEDEIYSEYEKLKDGNLTNTELVKAVSEKTGIDLEIVTAYIGEI